MFECAMNNLQAYRYGDRMNQDRLILKAGRTQSMTSEPPRLGASCSSRRMASGTLLKAEEGLELLLDTPELESALLHAFSRK